MQTVKTPQGSPEWHRARAGAITASMFAEVRKRANGLTDQQRTYVDNLLFGYSKAEAAKAAGYKSAPSGDKIERALAGEEVGTYTEAAQNYAFRLAVERISGEPLDQGFETWQARRGHELEPQARDLHQFLIDREIEQTGVVLTDDGKFGASADGLIGGDGGSEYKCLLSPEKIRAILFDGDLSEFTDQVQGCMWLTGRRWWEFVLYCPALKSVGKEIYIHRLERDDDYIESMERDLLVFDDLVCKYEAKLRDNSARVAA